MYDKILKSILNVCGVPQELLKAESSNIASIKIQQDQFKKKIEKQIK
jgi:hypothetical protein